MNKCIIKKDDKFEVIGYEGDDVPAEAVIELGQSYYSVYNGIQFKWAKISNSSTAFIIYDNDDKRLEYLENPSMHSIADFMNKYYKLKL